MGLGPGLRASLGPDSCSPDRFDAERDGQVEHASILDRFPGPDITIYRCAQSGDRYQWPIPISDPPHSDSPWKVITKDDVDSPAHYQNHDFSFEVINFS